MKSDDNIYNRLVEFYDHQMEKTISHLESANNDLKNELQILKIEERKKQQTLDFHYRLEKDFFSADSLKDLIQKLLNCLLLHLEADFVSLSFNQQYLESMLGKNGLEQLIAELKTERKVGYVSILDEVKFMENFGRFEKATIIRTPNGSSNVFFPEHGEEVKSQAVIPLILHGKTIGCLSLGSVKNIYSIQVKVDMNSYDMLAVKLAIAVDNILSQNKLAFQKELIDREIERAAIFQESLLPNLTLNLEQINVFSFFRPCNTLGGDFFDILHFSSEKFGVVIADVAGHGISAALIAAMLKFSFQMDDVENLAPNEIVLKINDRFCDIFKNGDYITLCLAIIDPKQLTMNLARAGHPYPILFKTKSCQTIEFKPFGPPIGLERDVHYENVSAKLNSGDRLFLYTDGLVNTLLSSDSDLTFCDYIKKMGRKTGGPNITQALIDEIELYTEQQELEDDASLLAVSVK